jgi:hypothetical protein
MARALQEPGILSCILIEYDIALHVSAGMPGPWEGVVASIMLQLPFIRHMFAWIGAHPAGDSPQPTARCRLLRSVLTDNPLQAGLYHGRILMSRH